MKGYLPNTGRYLLWVLSRAGAVNMADLMPIALIFNTVSGHPNFDTRCDLNKDGVINMADVMVIALKFGSVVYK